MDPSTINPSNKMAYVQRTMQLSSGPVTGSSSKPSPYSNIFVVGDAADAFGAIAAGHTAFYQVR